MTDIPPWQLDPVEIGGNAFGFDERFDGETGHGKPKLADDEVQHLEQVSKKTKAAGSWWR